MEKNNRVHSLKNEAGTTTEASKDRSKFTSRRDFLKQVSVLGGALLATPFIPSAVFADIPPSDKITLGCIGVGRMGSGDLRDIIGFDEVQVVAVCDLDSWRLQNAKRYVDGYYTRKNGSPSKSCTMYNDFRDLLAEKSIDAVQICTPDHWHALPAYRAAEAGKDIFLQKPLTLTIREGRILSDTVRKFDRILQVGSQQRSSRNFRFACELVRNRRIGELKTIKIGLPLDVGTTPQPTMPVPDNLNYNMWLGQAPWAPYTEKRVHPQHSYSRPGWLRIHDYSAGMITGWGAHHLDIARWGMGTINSGVIEVKGHAEFPRNGIWDVHGKFHVEYRYPNGTKLIVTGNEENKQGVLFEGEKGWVYVKRGAIDAHPKSLLQSVIRPSEIHLYRSNNHKGNLLECIRTRKEPVAPVENGHRSNTLCLLGDIAMHTEGVLKWDIEQEKIVNDEQANRMVSRPKRAPWHLP